jgi:V/A-type H+-transporting ATPase subunit K
MNKKIFAAAVLFLCIMATGLFAQSETTGTTEEQAVVTTVDNSKAFKYMAACIAVGLACIAGGLAVGKIGAAAMGAMSENAELSGKALPFVGLAEGICLWGFLVAMLILNN